MKTPRSRLRITAYQSVEASLLPRIGCQGFAGVPASSIKPASMS